MFVQYCRHKPPPSHTTLTQVLLLQECVDMGGIVIGNGCDTPHYVADVFFFSCLLFLFTFGISITLKNFRNARFFPNKVSRTCSALLCCVC